MLFGEGKTEAVFLRHLCGLYASEITALVKIDAGQGGAPKQVVSRLINKHLVIAAYDRSLLLIDEDLTPNEIPASWLNKYRIRVVTSSPMCLEGLLLTLLDDPPPQRERRLSKNWKNRFHRKHLGTDRETKVTDRLRHKCGELFPKSLIDARKSDIPALRELLEFLTI